MIYIYIFSLYILISPFTAHAISCNEYNWDGAYELEELLAEKYTEGVKLRNTACGTKITGNSYNSKKEIISEINDRLKAASEAHNAYRDAKKVLTKVENRWIGLHYSCNGEASSAAYDNYKGMFDWGKKTFWGGKDAVDDLLGCQQSLRDYRSKIRNENSK